MIKRWIGAHGPGGSFDMNAGGDLATALRFEEGDF